MSAYNLRSGSVPARKRVREVVSAVYEVVAIRSREDQRLLGANILSRNFFSGFLRLSKGPERYINQVQDERNNNNFCATDAKTGLRYFFSNVVADSVASGVPVIKVERELFGQTTISFYEVTSVPAPAPTGPVVPAMPAPTLPGAGPLLTAPAVSSASSQRTISIDGSQRPRPTPAIAIKKPTPTKHPVSQPPAAENNEESFLEAASSWGSGSSSSTLPDASSSAGSRRSMLVIAAGLSPAASPRSSLVLGLSSQSQPSGFQLVKKSAPAVATVVATAPEARADAAAPSIA